MWNKVILVATAVLAAVVVDIRSYMAALKVDVNATFNWKLTLTRAVEGLITGLLAAMGSALVPTGEA